MKISVTVQFHDELEFLDHWYKCALRYADQIVMAAHAPKDGSLEWAKNTKANSPIPIHILEFPEDTMYRHGFSYMKNAMLEHCTGDYIVAIDADEEMDMTKETLAPFFANAIGVSTQTMHLPEKQEGWSLENTQLMKDTAPWIMQRHWRIWRNRAGIKWSGIIHEVPVMPNNMHVSYRSRNSNIKMWHYGCLANPAKRGFKDGLYAELVLRIVENPTLRQATNKWWYTKFFEENKEKLYKDREEYRKQRSTVPTTAVPATA